MNVIQQYLLRSPSYTYRTRLCYLMTSALQNTHQLSCEVEAEPIARYRSGGYHPVHLGDLFKDGRYQIINKLGYGSYSTVWAARDQSVKRNVALKIGISETSSGDRESRVLQLCSNLAQEPGAGIIPTLIDSFEHHGPNGLHQCFVLDILGPAVPAIVEGLHKARLPKKAVVKVVGEVLSGLALLHKLNLGHGDIHVGNLCYTAPSLAKASEAELAQILGQPRTGLIHGKPDGNSIIGIPNYLVWPSHMSASKALMANPIKIIDFDQSFTRLARPETLRTPLVLRAPELLFKDDWDYRVDLWAVGCTIFELITGQPPFDSIMATENTIIIQMAELIGEPPIRWKERLDHSVEGQFNPLNPVIADKLGESENDPTSLQGWLEELYGNVDCPSGFSQEDIQGVGDIIRQLMKFEPAERMSASEALHRWSSLFN